MTSRGKDLKMVHMKKSDTVSEAASNAICQFYFVLIIFPRVSFSYAIIQS